MAALLLGYHLFHCDTHKIFLSSFYVRDINNIIHSDRCDVKVKFTLQQATKTCLTYVNNIQGVSGGTINILGGGSMKYSE